MNKYMDGRTDVDWSERMNEWMNNRVSAWMFGRMVISLEE
jgi:hypothetical protein